LTDKFFWADTDVFHFSLPIFLYYSSSIYILPQETENTSKAILPSAKHFPTTAEKHYSAFFLQAT